MSDTDKLTFTLTDNDRRWTVKGEGSTKVIRILHWPLADWWGATLTDGEDGSTLGTWNEQSISSAPQWVQDFVAREVQS